MKTTLLLAAALVAASASAAADPLPQHHPKLLLAPANVIVGDWEFQGRFIDCTTGATVRPLRASSLFHAGGTMVDTSTAPTVVRGPGFGVWTYDPATNTYITEMRLNRYNPDGSFAGVNQVRRVLKLSSDGNSATGTWTGQILDPNEQPLANTCGEETGVRAL